MLLIVCERGPWLLSTHYEGCKDLIEILLASLANGGEDESSATQ